MAGTWAAVLPAKLRRCAHLCSVQRFRPVRPSCCAPGKTHSNARMPCRDFEFSMAVTCRRTPSPQALQNFFRACVRVCIQIHVLWICVFDQTESTAWNQRRREAADATCLPRRGEKTDPSARVTKMHTCAKSRVGLLMHGHGQVLPVPRPPARASLPMRWTLLFVH